jgi:hypothetical protein
MENPTASIDSALFARPKPTPNVAANAIRFVRLAFKDTLRNVRRQRPQTGPQILKSHSCPENCASGHTRRLCLKECPQCADMEIMREQRVETRVPIMAKAEAWWKDAAGASQTAQVKIEDTSPSGAGLRTATPIPAGSKLTVKWHREQFSGVVAYCRRDGADYLVGVRREKTEKAVKPERSIAT